MASIAGMVEPHAQVGRGQMGLRAVGPFDQADGGGGEEFVQSCIEKFFRNTEPIKIKVVQV